jgi:hypothetical protein
VLASVPGALAASRRQEEVSRVRLSDWRARAPHRESLSPKVVAVIEPAVLALGAERDPGCWIVWGDDPSIRYLVLVPTDAGLLQVHVRVNVPGEGPRASAKLVRWNRVQVGELAVEVVSGHRLVTFQAEGQVFSAADADADGIAAFAQELFAAMDGRRVPTPAPPATRAARATKPAATPAKAAGAARRSASAKGR